MWLERRDADLLNRVRLGSVFICGGNKLRPSDQCAEMRRKKKRAAHKDSVIFGLHEQAWLEGPVFRKIPQ